MNHKAREKAILIQKIPVLFLRYCCVFVVSGIFLSTAVCAQSNDKQKSALLLKELSKAKNDTNKVKLYWKVINNYLDINYDSAILFCAPALQLAEQLKWNKGIAVLKAVIGRVYWRKGIFNTAIQYHLDALNYSKGIKDLAHTALLYTYLAQDYADAGRYQDATQYLEQADLIYHQTGDISAIASNYILYAFIYSVQGNYYESIRFNYKALKIYENSGDKYGAAICLANIADAYVQQGNYPEALKILRNCNNAVKEAGDMINYAGNYISIGSVYILMGKFREAIRSLDSAYAISEKLNNHYMMASAKMKLGEVYLHQNKYRPALAELILSEKLFRRVSNKSELVPVLTSAGICYTRLGNYAEAESHFKEAESISRELTSRFLMTEYYRGIEILDSARGDWRNAYRHYKMFVTNRDSINSIESTKKILQQQYQYESEKKETLAKAEQEKRDIRQRNQRNLFIAAGLCMLLMAAGLWSRLIYIRRTTAIIKKEKERSESLLLNILPEEVAEELKAKGNADARLFNEVTVMFTDFKGFTQLAEKLSPSELVAEIHTCFKAFDEIIGRYNIEKIKTIGDSYMCAGGLPVASITHAMDVVNAALEINQFMLQHKQQKYKDHQEPFEIRIGIHTGPVVAGIVGVKKFAYDIWGDTVNIASRMESSGEAGMVNISAATYELVKDKLHCRYRGKIDAKNKGEIEMYFVETPPL